MSPEVRLVGAASTSLLAVLILTPLAIRLAERLLFHDHPADYKQHARSTPYLGGAAVLLATLIGSVIFGLDTGQFIRLGACALGLWVVGTLDDRYTIKPSLRVGVELIAGYVLWRGGFGWHFFESEFANLVATCIWIVAIVNAFNLMDNMDGTASTVAAVSAAGAGTLAIVQVDTATAVIAFSLCGACLGFLRYNLTSPARIFLGDGGSMPIGFLIAALLMILPDSKHTGLTHSLAALLIVGIPVLDVVLVSVSRFRRSVSLIAGARDHLTHRLHFRVNSTRIVALLVGVTQAMLCALAVTAITLGKAPVVTAAVAFSIFVAIVVIVLEAIHATQIKAEQLKADATLRSESPSI